MKGIKLTLLIVWGSRRNLCRACFDRYRPLLLAPAPGSARAEGSDSAFVTLR
jgi:hypothetical protein